jgi:phosphoribosyl 1,2-cyclic phosphate phosphodiesterase
VESKNIKITILGSGTSSGVPMIACMCAVCKSTNSKDKRLRSSIAIQSENTTIVVDTGPDFRQQMLQHNITKLDGVVFTHSHKDHTAGLDDVRAYNFLHQKPMPLYATAFTEMRLRNEFDYAFSAVRYEGVPQLCFEKIGEESFSIGDIQLTPIQVWHHKMPVLGFRIGNFAYITDANKIEDNSMQQLEGVEILVINALRKQKHLSHFTLEESIAICTQLNIQQGYFTHISHQLGLHNEINHELPAHLQLAYDGLTIEIKAKS